MKSGQWVALIGGTALGLAGVAAGVFLARREGREAAQRWIDDYARPIAGQAKELGQQVVQTAQEQYNTQKPKAVEAWNTYAPQAREMLGSYLPIGGNNKRAATIGGMDVDVPPEANI